MPTFSRTVSRRRAGNAFPGTSIINSCSIVTPPPEVHAHRRGVGWLLSIQNLDDGRQRRVHVVSGKSVHGEAGGVRHKPTEGYFLVFGELVVGNLPRLQLVVDVFIQRELALSSQRQRGRGRDRLADRARLKQRSSSHGRGRSGANHAVSLRPDNFVVVDYGDAHAGHIVGTHGLRQIEAERWVFLAHRDIEYPSFDSLDSRFLRGRGGG